MKKKLESNETDLSPLEPISFVSRWDIEKAFKTYAQRSQSINNRTSRQDLLTQYLDSAYKTNYQYFTYMIGRNKPKVKKDKSKTEHEAKKKEKKVTKESEETKDNPTK